MAIMIGVSVIGNNGMNQIDLIYLFKKITITKYSNIRIIYNVLATMSKVRLRQITLRYSSNN